MAEANTAPVERHMSDIEALMWNIEKDPYLSMTFSNVTILDRTPDPKRLRARMARAVQAVPRLRQRVVPALGRLAPPEWRDDPDFDVDYHIRHIALPAPGNERTLFDLATVLASVPLDRTRPLWEFTIVDGLDGDRAALVQKVHHTITDGEGGVRLSAEFLDLNRRGRRRLPLPAPVRRDDAHSLVTTAVDTAAHNVRRQLGRGRRAAENTLGLLLHPSRVPRVGADVVAATESLVRQVAVVEHAHSQLWTNRSLHRRFEVLRVPLDEARLAAKALDGSINDLFVAGAAGGAGAYHRANGVDVDDLRISMPVSRRDGGSAAGNAFAPARVLVPAGITDPVERFVAVHERLTVTKHERSLGMVEALAGLVNLLPTSVLVRLARQQVETVDFATSNVRGAPVDLYIAGAKIEANYPMGPTGGTAFNITVLSSGNSLDVGVNIDTAAVEDPELLRRCLEEAYAELLAAAGP